MADAIAQEGLRGHATAEFAWIALRPNEWLARGSLHLDSGVA